MSHLTTFADACAKGDLTVEPRDEVCRYNTYARIVRFAQLAAIPVVLRALYILLRLLPPPIAANIVRTSGLPAVYQPSAGHGETGLQQACTMGYLACVRVWVEHMEHTLPRHAWLQHLSEMVTRAGRAGQVHVAEYAMQCMGAHRPYDAYTSKRLVHTACVRSCSSFAVQVPPFICLPSDAAARNARRMGFMQHNISRAVARGLPRRIVHRMQRVLAKHRLQDVFETLLEGHIQ